MCVSCECDILLYRHWTNCILPFRHSRLIEQAYEDNLATLYPRPPDLYNYITYRQYDFGYNNFLPETWAWPDVDYWIWNTRTTVPAWPASYWIKDIFEAWRVDGWNPSRSLVLSFRKMRFPTKQKLWSSLHHWALSSRMKALLLDDLVRLYVSNWFSCRCYCLDIVAFHTAMHRHNFAIA